ncbi:MAG: hypothetical protein PHN54_03190 [Bacilli bacterium]|nr:hypothetical protein [Bacilli bacterium]
MDLVFEVTTKSNSVYKLFSTRDKKTVVLKSDSPAFRNIDFILLGTIFITDRLSFVGVLYSNAVINKKGKIENKYPDKEVFTIDMNTEQYTTEIEGIKIVNKKIFDKLCKTSKIKIKK